MIFVRPKVLNFRSRSIQQSSNPSPDLSASPYTNAGLFGNNQVISIADTGIDDDSCYFIDTSNGPVPRSTTTSPQAYPNQRVVIQYAVYESGGGCINKLLTL
jgi:hypothetical protein